MSRSEKTTPTGNYPFPLTYIVIGVSMLFSAVATGLLSYFVYYLRMDSMSVPWEFILLLAASSATLASHILSLVQHRAHSAHPLRSLLGHAALLALWVAGLATLAQKIGPMVLSSTCGMSTWLTPMGIMVCRIYKALFAFIVLSLSALIAVAVLDVRVWFDSRQVANGGAYWEVGGRGKKHTGLFPLRLGGRAKTWKETGGIGYESHTMASPPMGQSSGVGGRGIPSWKQHSPDLSDAGDMGDAQRLVKESPEMGYTPYATPKIS